MAVIVKTKDGKTTYAKGGDFKVQDGHLHVKAAVSEDSAQIWADDLAVYAPGQWIKVEIEGEGETTSSNKTRVF